MSSWTITSQTSSPRLRGCGAFPTLYCFALMDRAHGFKEQLILYTRTSEQIEASCGPSCRCSGTPHVTEGGGNLGSQLLRTRGVSVDPRGQVRSAAQGGYQYKRDQLHKGLAQK
jgi:hypothetical protein